MQCNVCPEPTGLVDTTAKQIANHSLVAQPFGTAPISVGGIIKTEQRSSTFGSTQLSEYDLTFKCPRCSWWIAATYESRDPITSEKLPYSVVSAFHNRITAHQLVQRS
jgi:hypothetical protein